MFSLGQINIIFGSDELLVLAHDNYDERTVISTNTEVVIKRTKNSNQCVTSEVYVWNINDKPLVIVILHSE